MDIVGLKCLNEINRNLLLVTHAVVLLYILRSSVPVKCLARPGYRHGTCRWYRWRWRRGFGGSAMLVQILLCIFVFYWHCLRTAMCHQCYPASLPKICFAEDELDVDEVSWWAFAMHIFVDYFHGTFKASRLFRYKFGVKCFSLGSPIFFCIRCCMDTWII